MGGGKFVVSLDFEIHWGVHDKRSVAAYRRHLLGVREVVPALLECFLRRRIRATWATAGLLFFATRAEMFRHLPAERPKYANRDRSPYPNLEVLTEKDEESDPFHFACSLIEQVASTPGQEIGTHTFSHYYCLEPPVSSMPFRADLEAAKQAASMMGVKLRTIVFPRNQMNALALDVVRNADLAGYRGNPTHWLYTPKSDDDEYLARRALRLLDAYLPLTPALVYSPKVEDTGLVNVPASRFLRPVDREPRILQRLRLRRIIREMTVAAQQDKVFHLWWHPHNFGAYLPENMAFLEEILEAFDQLAERYGMQSANMYDVTRDVLRGR